MKNKSQRLSNLIELTISFGVLLLILYYAFLLIYVLPYNGLRFRSDTGSVTQVYTRNDPNQKIFTGDVILKVGDLTWDEYLREEESMHVSFKRHQPGDQLILTIQRQGRQLILYWIFPTINTSELAQRAFLTPWVLLPLFLWLCGFGTLLVVRPRDRRRNLLVALYYICAIWAITVSLWDIRYSGLLFILTSWMIIPVAWHFHWVFPRIIRTLNPLVWATIYITALAGALVNILKTPRASPYPFLLIAAFGGSIIILCIHYYTQPDLRRQIIVLITGLSIAVVPGMILLVTSQTTFYPQSIRAMAFSFLIALPISYFYVLFFHRLGSLELRANSVIGLLFFGVIIFLINYVLIHYIFLSRQQLTTPLISILVASLTTGVLTALFYPRLHHWFEQHVLGIPLPQIKLLTTYAGEIITASDSDQLVHLITDQIFPSLLIRQAALLRVQVSEDRNAPASFETLVKYNIEPDQDPLLTDLRSLIHQAGHLIPLEAQPTERLSWIRLVLVKQAEPDWLVLCLLGRRDPDDYYSPNELPTFQALVDNTTLALINITQNRLLHSLYQEDILRREREYHRLALDLHDDVLNQLALLAQTVDDSQASPEFVKAYQNSVQRVREIIGGLRPPLLNFGLRAALDGLLDEYTGQTSQEVNFEINIPPSAVRYPPEVELQVYRIVQQACQNAIQHSHAGHIIVQGSFIPNQIELNIQDDGIGMEHSGILDLDWLIATRHFGLAGMFERAELIGANIALHSQTGEGAIIQLSWNGQAAVHP